MSTITVAEAVKLQDTLSKKIVDLLQERGRAATATIEKGETAEYPARSVDLITAEVKEVREDLRILKDVVRKANALATLHWDKQDMSIATALDLVKDIRSEAEESKNLGNRRKQDRDNGSRFGTSIVTTFTVALYEPDDYRAHGAKLLAVADKLSMLIQMNNLGTPVQFPSAKKYMIVDL